MTTRTYDYSTNVTVGNYYIHDGTGKEIGDIIDFTPIYDSTSYWAFAIIPCKAGDNFTITSRGILLARAWAFTDNDHKLISVSGARVDFSGTKEAPADGYFIYQTYNTVQDNLDITCILTREVESKNIGEGYVVTEDDDSGKNVGIGVIKKNADNFDDVYERKMSIKIGARDYRVCQIGAQLWTAEYLTEDVGDNVNNTDLLARFYNMQTIQSDESFTSIVPTGWKLPSYSDLAQLYTTTEAKHLIDNSRADWTPVEGQDDRYGMGMYIRSVYRKSDGFVKGDYIYLGASTADTGLGSRLTTLTNWIEFASTSFHVIRLVCNMDSANDNPTKYGVKVDWVKKTRNIGIGSMPHIPDINGKVMVDNVRCKIVCPHDAINQGVVIGSKSYGTIVEPPDEDVE